MLRTAVHRFTFIFSTTAIIDAASMSRRFALHSAIAPPFRKGTQICAVPVSVLRPHALLGSWIALHRAIGWVGVVARLVTDAAVA